MGLFLHDGIRDDLLKGHELYRVDIGATLHCEWANRSFLCIFGRDSYSHGGFFQLKCFHFYPDRKSGLMKKLLVIFAFAILCAPCFAQQYTPTKAQHDKLAKERAHIIAMQEKISDLQNQIAYEIEQATVTCKQIAAENGWPADVTCNLQTLSFAAPAVKEASKEKK